MAERGPIARPVLHLYLAGDGLASRRAMECRASLIKAMSDGIDIEVIDVLAEPAKAETAGILATPTLSDETQNPPRRIVGDFSDTARVLTFLGYGNGGTAA